MGGRGPVHVSARHLPTPTRCMGVGPLMSHSKRDGAVTACIRKIYRLFFSMNVPRAPEDAGVYSFKVPSREQPLKSLSVRTVYTVVSDDGYVSMMRQIQLFYQIILLHEHQICIAVAPIGCQCIINICWGFHVDIWVDIRTFGLHRRRIIRISEAPRRLTEAHIWYIEQTSSFLAGPRGKENS